MSNSRAEAQIEAEIARMKDEETKREREIAELV